MLRSRESRIMLVLWATFWAIAVAGIAHAQTLTIRPGDIGKSCNDPVQIVVTYDDPNGGPRPSSIKVQYSDNQDEDNWITPSTDWTQVGSSYEYSIAPGRLAAGFIGNFSVRRADSSSGTQSRDAQSNPLYSDLSCSGPTRSGKVQASGGGGGLTERIGFYGHLQSGNQSQSGSGPLSVSLCPANATIDATIILGQAPTVKTTITYQFVSSNPGKLSPVKPPKLLPRYELTFNPGQKEKAIPQTTWLLGGNARFANETLTIRAFIPKRRSVSLVSSSIRLICGRVPGSPPSGQNQSEAPLQKPAKP